MSFFGKLFKKTQTATNKESSGYDSWGTIDAAMSAINEIENDYNNLAMEKDLQGVATENKLIQYFVEYFAPNREFYSTPGSNQYKAYFTAVNTARDEMIKSPELFAAATGWDISRLLEMLKNPKPVVTNMLVCGLIFRMGSYGVVKSAVYCVDFCEQIPNCIALYLLLTIHKLPPERRKQIIDTGEGADSSAFKAAMESLHVLDSSWSFTIV